MRYGPNRISVREDSALRKIYGPGSRFSKSSWYSSWSNPGSWSLFSDQNIQRHARGRSLFQSTYSMTALVNYEPFVDECADLFEQRLSEIAQSGIAIDMRHWFQCYAFDVISSITYAKRFGFLDRGEDIEYLMSALDGHLIYATIVGLIPSSHSFLYTVRNWWGGSRGSGRGYLLNFTLQQMRQGLEDAKATVADHQGKENVEDIDVHDRPQAFLSKFLARHANDPTKFTHDHVVASCVSNIVAGSDTTAISLSATLYYLITTPHSLEALRSEIDMFRSQSRLSSQPTFSETQQMPYLQAVIREALRMHPVTGLPLERVVPEGGVEIGGRHIPARSIVGTNPWVEHRNTVVFGHDAHQFRPERWLDGNAEAQKRMSRHYMPVSVLCDFCTAACPYPLGPASHSWICHADWREQFGMGSRTCIGRHISMLEMTKLIPRIVQDFDLSEKGLRASDRAHWTTRNVWFVKPTSFKVRIKARPSSSTK